MKKLLYTISLLLLVQLVFAQKNENQLALKYFQDQEFDKAAALFEKLFDKKKDKANFNYYVKSLIKLKDFKTAEKVVKSQMRRNRNDVSYQIEYGFLLKLQGKTDKAEEQFNEVIDNLQRSQYAITNTANMFAAKNEYDYSLKTFARGVQLLGDPNLFRFDKARIHAMQRNYDGMIDEYLELLRDNNRYYSVVQNNLRYYLSYDVDDTMSKLLKKKLLQYVRLSPDQSAYTELLIWLYLQEKKFNAAFIQVRALDLRMNSTGKHLLEFAQVAMSNNAYSAAVKAYNTIIGFAEKADPAIQNAAQSGILEASFKELTSADSVQVEKFQELEQKMKLQVRKHNQVPRLQLISKLAKVQAYYLAKPDSATETLVHFLGNRRINRTDKAEAELLLADIQLASNNPWEAILTYARVEKANKHNEIGHEAKFRKTKVAYFTGDFQWAKAQLDILKASTTKLIANDAFAMSLLIKDNLVEDDSVSEPLQQFARAQMAVLQKRNNDALAIFDSVATANKTSTIAEYALFEKAKVLKTQLKYKAAAETYEKLIADYAFSIWTDDALFELAQILQFQFHDEAKAKGYYEKILLNHKGSVLIPEARKHYRKLRGDGMNKEAKFFHGIDP